MKELDLTGVKMVQEHRKNLSETDLKQKQESIYSKSLQDGKKKQEIHGKTYVNKNMKKNIVIAAAGLAGIILFSKGVNIGFEVDEYNRVLNQKMEQELTNSEIETYQNENAKNIVNNFKIYQDIKKEENNLDSNNYNILGQNVVDTDKKYLEIKGDDIISLTEKQQDAIDVATDNVIDEYKGRGK